MKVYCAFSGATLLKISISPIPMGFINGSQEITYLDFEIGSIENRYPEILRQYIDALPIETRHKLLGELEKTDYALYLVVLLTIPGLLDHALRLIFEHPYTTHNDLVEYVKRIEENNNVNS
jgi:hypothetical protein